MRTINCEAIRRELDELMLDAAWSAAAAHHLHECADCREFQQQQNRLRQIVGSLGTVAAPADFDFRLRARLAGDASNAGFHLSSAYWPFARRALAAAALLLVFATGVVLVRNIVNQQKGTEEIANQAEPAPPPPPSPKATLEVKEVKPPEFSAAIPKSDAPPVVKKERLGASGSNGKRSVASMDFSNERAAVINGSEAVGNSRTAVFSIDASLQSLRVSLDDGRGNARTISVPTISFGSQRMMPNGNQFAQKGVW